MTSSAKICCLIKDIKLTMRNEKEMFDLISQTAQQDERIRAVILEGSRANPHASKDILQDYDIVYIVSEMEPFVRDHEWVKCFGELLIMQIPDSMGDQPHSTEDHFAYLMQFRDGTRIDLSLYTLEAFQKRGRDSLSVLLLDKDTTFESFPVADESDYLPHPPTSKAFDDCCNEFWWVCPYVAKGLWRGEITYAKYMLDVIVRAQLMKLLNWYIGMCTEFKCNPGKEGKYFQKYLSTEEWKKLMRTYADADPENNWRALFNMADLFRVIARQIAEHFALDYPDAKYQHVLVYLKQIQNMPKDKKELS